jgi:hypothetical protein
MGRASTSATAWARLLVAGRTGQKHNRKKDRKRAYWEDRYHAAAVESFDYLARCMVYIDTNMVCAKGRDVIEGNERYPPREGSADYQAFFEAEKRGYRPRKQLFAGH